MAAIGIVLAWLGYSVFYYGVDTVTGGNDSFLSLVWPGRYQPTARDGAGGVPANYAPGVGTGPGGSNAGNPPGYSSGSTSPGGSASTPPPGWLPAPGSPGWYYSPKQPGEIWIPGQGVLQQ